MTMAQLFKKVTELRSSFDILVDPPDYWLPSCLELVVPAEGEVVEGDVPMHQEDIPLDPTTPPLPLPPDPPTVGQLNFLSFNMDGGQCLITPRYAL